MNEKTYRYLCIISIICCFVFAGINGILGKNLYDNRNTIKQFENDYSAAKRRIVSIKEGLDRVSRESRRRRRIIQDLQSSIEGLQNTITELEKANNRLRIANQKLDELREKLKSGNKIIENSSIGIGKAIERIAEIIQEIEE